MFGAAPFGALAFSQGFTFATLTATLVSAFNFCNPFDHILPPADGSINRTDRAHLWGLYSGIAVGAGGEWEMIPPWKKRRRIATNYI